MEANMYDKLVESCIEVLVCAELDIEINFGGNGANPFECVGFAMEILEIMGIDTAEQSFDDKYTKKLKEYTELYK